MAGFVDGFEDSLLKGATEFATKADEVNNNNTEFNGYFETLYESLTGFKDNTVVLKDKLINAVEQFGGSVKDLKNVFIAYFKKLNETIETFKDPKEFMDDMTSRIKKELLNEAGNATLEFAKKNGASLLKDGLRTGVKLYTNPLEAVSEAASTAVSAAASAGPKAIAEAPKQIMEKSPIMMEKILREKFAIIIDLIEFIELFQGGVKATPEAGAPGGGPAPTSGGAPEGAPEGEGVPGGAEEAISEKKPKVQKNPLSPEEIKTKMAELLGKHTANSDSDSDISSKTAQITKLISEMDVEKMKNDLSEIRVQFLEFNGFSTEESPVEQMKSLFNQLKIDMENLATKLKTGAEIERTEKEKEKGDTFNKMHDHDRDEYRGGTRRNKTNGGSNQKKRKSSKRKTRK